MSTTGPYETGWIKPKHDCMDVFNERGWGREKHTGSVWRCGCGKAWRVFGILSWRLRRYDAKGSM